MERPIIINILGNSVGLKVRPPEDGERQFNYAKRLASRADAKIRVVNYSRTSETVASALTHRFDYLGRVFPDVVVVHLGINDCVPRLTPQWLFDVLSAPRLDENKYVYVIRAQLSKVVNYRLAPRLIPILKLGPWCAPEKFSRKYRKLIVNIRKEFTSKIICVGINPCTERIEKLLPGARKNIETYNSIIQDICNNLQCNYIATDRWTDDTEADTLFPDGVHFSSKAHGLMAEAIHAIITNQVWGS